MSIDIIIRDTPADRLAKLSKLFKGYYRWSGENHNIILIIVSPPSNDTSTYSSLSEDDLATLEFLPDFDTRYTYLLSLSLGINA